MTVLIQTHINNRVSFTEIAYDIVKVNDNVEWELGDHFSHVPLKRYEAVLYIGSMMRIDVARFYRYMFWTGKHVYYGVTEGPPILDIASMAATKYMRMYVPSNYVKWELENAGIRVDGIIPHGVDVERIGRADHRKWREMFGDRIVLLYVAHRNIRKGFRELMEAWRMTRASRDDGVLLVLHTTSAPNTLSGEQYVKFDGNVLVTENILKLNKDDLYGLYKACDIYVHAALAEGFGIPIVEAMAAGKPVLCIDAPPMNEHVNDKRMLVKVDRQEIYNDRGYATFRMNYPDLRDFAEKIDWIVYAGREVWRDIGERNRETCARRYGLENYRAFGKIAEM
ncbi:MAG: glycosyltransferase family 4 protein [Nitrososphaerota archaeon]